MATKKNLQQKVDQIILQAEKRGLSNDETFLALMDDFLYKKELLERLREKIDSSDLVVEKEYIKGKPNANPNSFISLYNSTSNSMCNTVNALTKLLKATDPTDDKEEDPLLRVLGGNK